LPDGSCGILRDINSWGEGLRYNHDKYVTIWLFNKKQYVHVLVARAFLINKRPDIFKQVDHIDRNPRNNCVTNLRWVSASVNNQHRVWNKAVKFNWETLRWEMKCGKVHIK
jgi:hypothetical protein